MFQDFMNNKTKGQSLIEIMMAMVFFGVIALGLNMPVMNSLFVTHDNKNVNMANSLARSYLREIADEWKLQNNFDNATLAEASSEYTNNGQFNVTTNTENITTDDEGNVLVRRVNIIYTDSANTTLCDIHYDFNRPGNI